MEYGDGIGTNIWTTMGKESGLEPLAGVDNTIYNRVERLKTSVEILRKALERSEQGNVTSDILPPGSHRVVELGGIRRRIPRAASPSINEHDLGAGQISTVSEENNTLDDVSGIYLYSYLYAEDPPKDAIISTPKDANDSRTRRGFRLGIALREQSEHNRPYLDNAANIQLLSTSSCHIGSGPTFHGRVVNSARANLHLASEWLHECENGHQGLCETAARGDNVAHARTAPHNLRVIDVNSMSLVLLPQRSKYVALSYCWGQSNRHFITTNSNFVELQAKGSLQRTFPLLPRTIQDAINCVREIGRDFLWVDALCIIQDNDNDREMQILQMDRVYDNALLTIISAPPTLANSTPYDGLPGYRAGSRAFRQDIARVQALDLCTTFLLR
ncbi:uncharacterized protein LY89DRAFT_736992 [Mollisia scopiformis]|uniref:Heterokaryon incompatibility domain-containing protein n=1 Tax=Mollisia scopiformis TaxID=149040 RepID=A0A194X1X3_MOLSC|nr:uncharacterized protein LY89DRAFT_736992 [Mollisia scopiformis]KUJ13989.1 hypothetical protein LY89DRAFT_736992 [Mollisia scopiformis]